MPVAVEGVDADPPALVAEVLQVVAVGGVARCDQGFALGERLGLIEELPLLRGADGNPDLAAPLVPRGLEHQRVAPVGPGRNDLDRGLKAQPEGRLQAQRHPGTGGADGFELFPAKRLCL